MDTKKIPEPVRFKGSKIAEKLLGTKYPPCCGDLIGSVTCKRLKANNAQAFLNRCELDPDFSLIQCCNSCGINEAPARHEKFFLEGEKSKHCFDRHEDTFCHKFLERSDVWSPGQWSCSGEYAHLAFRICRKTCQYCNPNIYKAPDGGKWKPTACGSVPELIHVITK
uniref:ShKT domain-containing protein n=1 Tax=Panagrolaimus sp. ES5 TaxID=591445 RepID=A0AC34FQS0_9BILA